MRAMLLCGHCGETRNWKSYVKHVKACIEEHIRNWDEEAYSKAYYKQVRALSRYSQPGDPRRRKYRQKSWGWWVVAPKPWGVIRPDGLPIQSLVDTSSQGASKQTRDKWAVLQQIKQSTSDYK